MISKLQQIAQETGVKIKNVESMSKSKWKKQMKKKERKFNRRKNKTVYAKGKKEGMKMDRSCPATTKVNIVKIA